MYRSALASLSAAAGGTRSAAARRDSSPPLPWKKYNFRPNGPVFACPCHLSVYDIAQNGKVVSGPAPRLPYRFELDRSGTTITVTTLEKGNIA